MVEESKQVRNLFKNVRTNETCVLCTNDGLTNTPIKT